MQILSGILGIRPANERTEDASPQHTTNRVGPFPRDTMSPAADPYALDINVTTLFGSSPTRSPPDIDSGCNPTQSPECHGTDGSACYHTDYCKETDSGC